MSNNLYWDSFYKSGKIEQYLRYRKCTGLYSKGNEYVGAKNSEDSKDKSDSN